MDAYLAVVGKREVRVYEPRPIPDDALRRIMEAGRAAGSSRNRQPWRFIVVSDRARLAALGATVSRPANVAECAAAVVVVLADPKGMFDAGRASQNIMLAAWDLGIGSCPNTPRDDGTLRRLLHLPDDAVVATILSLGYPGPGERRPNPSARPERVIGRINRLPYDDVVRKETYRS
jgi:nitroreductase